MKNPASRNSPAGDIAIENRVSAPKSPLTALKTASFI
jgi:hypothetical protein